jgi:hypothetical protein
MGRSQTTSASPLEPENCCPLLADILRFSRKYSANNLSDLAPFAREFIGISISPKM